MLTAQKIEDRSAVIGVLGLGYVGLPLASAFLEAGFPVLGFDTDVRKIESLAGRLAAAYSSSEPGRLHVPFYRIED